MRLIESVLSKTKQANRWQRKFIETILELLLMAPGAATFRNLSRYSDYEEKSFSRGFGRRYDWEAFNHEAIKQVVPCDHAQALVLDASYIKKAAAVAMDWIASGTAQLDAPRKGWRYPV